ncbi:uncharacterized protein N7477_001448 [Penicillium maclennaniae]|uniref:uncharacterized protein n=1 Tax=Penicillium maclennaniae TaxID=1343394 RepID=UPI00253F939F|nr:uncharacterized protein N7477_001448 [Penicillium maclennaniae]KAJ5681508.1 hypothetical protein N7477_001448 [Penicillium maclennaniae]
MPTSFLRFDMFGVVENVFGVQREQIASAVFMGKLASQKQLSHGPTQFNSPRRKAVAPTNWAAFKPVVGKYAKIAAC